MTLQECYVKIGGDYNDILHRFMNENMVGKFVEKLRSQEYDNLDGLIADVKKQYDIVIEAIAALG